MEACGTANYWCNQLAQLAHEVRQISPQYVARFRIGNKNDKNDAIAISEAFSRPDMRCVPIKNIEQQDRQCLHRVRQRLVKNRTAITNQIHGLTAEYGIALSEGKHKMPSEVQDENGVNKAIVVLANKNARMAWAIVKTGEAYKTV